MDLINGFLLGISSGINCIIACCPYLVPFFLSEKRSMRTNLFIVFEYLAGRMLAYIILGVISGIIGQAFNELKISGMIYSIFFILSSIMLFFYLLGVTFEFRPGGKIFNTVAERVPFVVGFFNGLNFCPPLIAAFSYGIAAKSIFNSIIFFILFFSGTSIYMLVFIFFGFLTSIENLRNAGRIAGFLVAGWFLIKGIFLLFKI